MKARTRKHQAQRLQLAAAKLGQWGKDSRFYGGAKWTRRQQAALAGAPRPGLEFNRILPRPGSVTA